MLLLKRLRLALRERSQRGVLELQRRVMKVEVMLLLLLLLCLERRRCLGEYVGHLTVERSVLRKVRRAPLSQELLRRCLLMLVLG